MRSSIACARCRRSKVKCINAGVDSVCKACELSGRECTYPAAYPPLGMRPAGVEAGHSLKNASANRPVTAPNGDTPRRPPKRRGTPSQSAVTPTRDSPRALLDALDPTVLTPSVWSDVYDIYQLHFSTDLPFIHAPSFRKPLNGLQPHPPASPLFLLSLLALTARFQTHLVRHHSPPSSRRPSDPVVASEYYASAVRSHLSGPSAELLAGPSMEKVQALLMLGLHEWGMCRGLQAWMYIGVAIRFAQAMGLEFEQELDDEPLALSRVMSNEAQYMGISPSRRDSREGGPLTEDLCVQLEIRRRTFWSCFIMDRYLSSGKYRPQMLHAQDLRIQLPSSERAFMFGTNVRTNLLASEIDEGSARPNLQYQRRAGLLHTGNDNTRYSGQHSLRREINDHDYNKVEVGPEEGELSRLVKMIEIWGRIAKWSCSGGRRTERYPPWDERSTFYDLRNLLERIHHALPRRMLLSATSIGAYVHSDLWTAFALMHIIHSLCVIVLHREYVPFIPIRCSKPEGPLDPPKFPPEEYDIPAGWWEESAQECFKAAREMVDLVNMCQHYHKMVETPIVGFAVYTVAFVGVYCWNFPHMDTRNYMGPSETRTALDLIQQMRPRLRMANGWFQTIQKVHQYLSRMKKDYYRNTKAGSDTGIGRPIREGGAGGGLEEYKILEKTLTEFGSLEDDEGMDISRPDSPKMTSNSGSDTVEVKREIMEGMVEGTSSSSHDRWTAINSGAPPVASSPQPMDEERSDYPTGHLPHISPNEQDPSSPTRPPPLLSPTHTVSTATSLPSPFPPSQLQENTSSLSAPPPPNGSSTSPVPHHRPAPPRIYDVDPAQSLVNWDPQIKENWLNSLPQPSLGGEDVAAFIDGTNIQETGGGGGWLQTVWGGGRRGR